MASAKEQFEVLTEGAVDLIASKEFETRLTESIQKKRPLRIKLGCDPSTPDLHLGHTVILRKLRQFQDFGHQVVFVVGDFTARIGDPSGQSQTRPALTPEQVKKNATTYQKQVAMILDPKKTEVRFNSEWLDKLKPQDILHLTSQYTVARLLERDDFEKRYKAGQPISIVEFLYPLMQGYDSVKIESDMELGGTDQKFNLLVGRELQKVWDQTPQMVMTFPLIEGTDGTQKMSKSLGNHIALQDSPKEMFGKVMSIPDTMMEKFYLYVSGLPREEVKQTVKGIKDGSIHPREAKVKLAESIVTLYHSKEAAAKAHQEFDSVFKNKALPQDIPEVAISTKAMDLTSLLKEAGLVSSKSEARRLIEQGGVKINQNKVTDTTQKISIDESPIIQCGKRKFAKVIYRGD